jgi:hypothetical protein
LVVFANTGGEEATHVPHHLVVKGAEAGVTAGAVKVTGMKYDECHIDFSFFLS